MCLGFDSAQHGIIIDDFMAWAESARPFCFPLGEGGNGESPAEPFHFMPFDDSGTHGFCRKMSTVRSCIISCCLTLHVPQAEALM